MTFPFGGFEYTWQFWNLWVKKKRSWFEAQPIIMEQKAWERLSERKRRKYERL